MFKLPRALGKKMRRRQHGVILLLIVLSMLAIVGTLFLAAVGASLNKRVIDPQTLELTTATKDSLEATKRALLNYVVNPPISTHIPGILPIPDSLGNLAYTGDEDTACLGAGANGLSADSGSNSVLKRCIGRIPWRALRMSFGDAALHDPDGVIPWLAISANLVVYDNCLKVLNSDVATLNSPATPTCPTISTPFPQPTTLPHKWLTVRDSLGNVLSDRVAAVLLMPGAPIATETRTQARTVAAPGNPSDHLDDVKLPLGCTTCTTYDNAGLTNEFVQIPLGTFYPDDSQDTSKRGSKVPFNDVVIYITVDEYMYYVERRVLAQMNSALKDSFTKTGSYPWAAAFASPSSYAPFVSTPGKLTGLMPFFAQPPLANTPSPNTLRIPNHPTTTSWSVASFQTVGRNCVQVRTGPNRWADLNQNIRTESRSLSGTATGTARWRGTGTAEFWGTTTATYNKTFALFGGGSATNCNNNGPLPGGTNSGTYPVTRTVTFNIDSDCANPNVAYGPATGAGSQTMNWTCPSLSTPPLFLMTIADSVSSPIARTNSQILVPSGQVSLASLRYQPVMPDWFHDHLWYQTAFFALSRNSMPAGGASADCSGISNVSIGGIVTTLGVSSLAGKRLSGSRPSASLSDYFESSNVAGFSNCTFTPIPIPGNSGLNDNFMAVTQ